MSFLLKRRLHPVSGLVDLVPAVTVVLLLLFFFLLSSSLVLQPGIKIDLPRGISSAGTPITRLMVAVALSPPAFDEHGLALPRTPSIYFEDQLVTLESLRYELGHLPPSRVPQTLILKLDQDVPAGLWTQLIGIASDHNLQVFIATQPFAPAAKP